MKTYEKQFWRKKVTCANINKLSCSYEKVPATENETLECQFIITGVTFNNQGKYNYEKLITNYMKSYY